MYLYYNTVTFKKQYPAILFWRGLTHMRSMCVGVAEMEYTKSNFFLYRTFE